MSEENQAQKSEAAETPARSLVVLLRELAAGQFDQDASKEFHQLLHCLIENSRLQGLKHKAKGTLTINLKLQVEGATEDFGGHLDIDYSMKVASPATPTARDTWYLDRKGRCLRQHPKQLDLKPRAVETPTEVREPTKPEAVASS